MTAGHISVAPPYSLARTLTSGQCFRWHVLPGAAGRPAKEIVARGIVDGAVAIVTQHPRGVSVIWEGRAGSLALLRRHLGADQPLGAVETELARDRVLRRLLRNTSGIALMRQEPWECLVSFVVSAFNNIPKITQSVRLIAQRFGSKIGGASGPDAWSFPRPDRLAHARPAELRGCILGYRAPYVRALARRVADGRVDLDRIASLPYADARAMLLDLPGVGEKVADCVLLFALGHHDAFPVDVWVQRAVERWYFQGRRMTPRAIRAWAHDRFGGLAGYAQQHIFAAARARGSGKRAGSAEPVASELVPERVD
ncbi:MAG: DNA-3-methyladenine glycosylase family protein [bacterium]